MLQLKNVSKFHGGKCVIRRADLSVKAGEVVCLAGPSGIGKTTLIEIMAGIIPADQGDVKLNELPALAFQDDILIPWLSARDNMEYALSGMPRHERRVKADIWLDRFGLLSNQKPWAMSGGMRRRLNLARAFASGRNVLLLDEPFAFLDGAWQELVADFIARAGSAGKALVISSHQLHFLKKIESRIVEVVSSPIVLSDGT